MNHKRTILVVEDEASISNFIRSILSSNGYNPILAANGTEAKSIFLSHSPDLVILDLGLPDMEGQDVITAIREWSVVPIIVVSARTKESDKVEALDLGADDYITKPFGISELLARVRAALRHADRESGGMPAPLENIVIKDMVIDQEKRRVTVNGEELHFTQIEFKLISLLAKHAGRVLTYDFIMKDIWGPYAAGDNQILRVNMANIRRKLKEDPADPKYILTELGVGYRMLDE